MANPKLYKTGSGTIPMPMKIQKGKEGDLSDLVIGAINSFNGALVKKINGRISFGDGSQSSLAGNIFGQFREFKTPSSANTEFRVDHGLHKHVFGRIVVRQNKAAHLYDSNNSGWGDSSVYFKCDVASTTFKVLLLADIDS